MSKVFAVHVAATVGAQRNLEAGLNHLTWGWRDSVLDKKNHRAIAGQIQVGDLLVMATHGPNTRVPEGGWATARPARVLLLRFTSAVHQGNTRIWPDEVTGVVYPNRADFEVLYDVHPPEAVVLEPAVLEALRWSANTQGSPVLVDLGGDRAPAFTIGGGAAGAGGQLNHQGEFDALAQVLVRREQRKIRAQKFGNRPDLECALCGKTYPARLVRAAHIKRRSACTPDELLDLGNIMAACAMGCDEMFEHGFISVDDGGIIIARRSASGDLAHAVSRLAGRTCQAFGTGASSYFAWHRSAHT